MLKTWLRAAVNLQLRRDLVRQLGDADILHNDRVRAGLGDRGQRCGGLAQLLVEDQRVEQYAQSFLPSGTTLMLHSIA